MNSFTDQLEYHACFSPNAVAITANKKSYTYGEVFGLVKKFATYMQNLGVRVGDVVFCRAEQSAEYAVAFLACQRMGAVFLSVDKDASPSLIKEHSAVLSIGKETDHVDGVPFVLLSDIFSACEGVEGLNKAVEGAKEGYIIRTSGSTGKPRAVLAPFSRGEEGKDLVRMLQYKAGDRLYLFAPVNHVAFFVMFAVSLAVGGEVVISQGMMDLSDFLFALEERKVNAIHATPTVVSFWLRRCGDLLKDFSAQINKISLAGERVPSGLFSDLSAVLPSAELYNLYGSSETGFISRYLYASDDEEVGCVGEIAPNVEVKIEDGRIAVKSPYNFLGYCPERRQDEWVRLNDNGYFKDGKLYVSGRSDDVIVLGGEKIDPVEVENVACRCSAVEDCLLLPEGNGTVLLVTWKDLSDENGLKEELYRALEGYKVPKKVVAVRGIRRNGAGKKDRRFYKENGYGKE